MSSVISPNGDYRDVVIADLAADEAAQREAVATRREMVAVLVGMIATRDRRIESLQGQLTTLKDELRRYTANAVAARTAA